MDRNERIDFHINAIAQEVIGYITENSNNYRDGWVPTAMIKKDLNNLRVSGYPQNKDKPARGWLFGIAARRLEDMNMIEYNNSEPRSFCRVKP
jgi:hypothetical protein